MRTVLNSAPDSGLNGVYTFKEEGETGEDICVDGCIFERDGEEYCFIEASGGETADVECQVWLLVHAITLFLYYSGSFNSW